jgi:anti-sigma-K factor RskA
MFAASVALFLISGFLSFLFYNKWQQAEERLQLAVASEQRLAQNLNTVSLKSAQQQEALAILRDADFKSVRLQGVEAHPEVNVLVYWNPKRQQVYVDRINLPAPPAGKQYQLWALDKGKPVDAGMIALNGQTDVLQQMKAIGSAQAFAITLEPAGGSENPTLEQLMVMGEVSL